MRRWWLKLYSYFPSQSSIAVSFVGSWVVRFVGRVGVDVEDDDGWGVLAVVLVVVVVEGLGGCWWW